MWRSTPSLSAMMFAFPTAAPNLSYLPPKTSPRTF
jgi:hypothetical protein